MHVARGPGRAPRLLGAAPSSGTSRGGSRVADEEVVQPQETLLDAALRLRRMRRPARRVIPGLVVLAAAAGGGRADVSLPARAALDAGNAAVLAAVAVAD